MRQEHEERLAEVMIANDSHDFVLQYVRGVAPLVLRYQVLVPIDSCDAGVAGLEFVFICNDILQSVSTLQYIAILSLVLFIGISSR